jgi:hypothetical protein
MPGVDDWCGFRAMQAGLAHALHQGWRLTDIGFTDLDLALDWRQWRGCVIPDCLPHCFYGCLVAITAWRNDILM